MDESEQKKSSFFDLKAIQEETKHRFVYYAAIAIVFGGGSFFTVSLVLFPWLTTAFPNSPEEIDWNLLEGFISLITLSLFVGSGVFVVLEYFNNEVQQRQERALASYTIYKDIFDRMTDADETAARRWIIKNIEPFDEKKQTKEAWLVQFQELLFHKPQDWNSDISPGQQYLKRVLNMFDYLGFVSAYYWHMEEEIMEWLSPPSVKVWERISLYVAYQIDERDEPDFYKSACEFGEKCIKWRADNIKEKYKIVGKTV